MWVSGQLARARYAVIAGAVCAAFCVIPAVAQASFSWSPPISIDKTTGVSLGAVACPSATQCSALDIYGRVLTFNPAAPKPPAPLTITSMPPAQGIACPTTTQCTIVGGGQESTFNPVAPGTPAAATLDTGAADAPAQIGAVACQSTTQCTAIDGKDTVITFNPASPAGASKAMIDATAKLGLAALACPSAMQCTAIDADGKEITFNPTTGASPTSATIAPSDIPSTIACPLATQCTAVDQGGHEMTFNPQAPGTITPVKIDSEFSNGLEGLACRSATSCTAVSQGGREVTFNPLSPGSPAPVLIDADAGGNAIGQNSGLSDRLPVEHLHRGGRQRPGGDVQPRHAQLAVDHEDRCGEPDGRPRVRARDRVLSDRREPAG